MPYKRNPKIASVGQFVNIVTSLTVVFLVSAGYFTAISGLPMTV
jgi:hypothetical protein